MIEMNDYIPDNVKELHEKSIIVDGLAMVYPKHFNEEYIQTVKKGGFTATHVTVPDIDCFSLSEVVMEQALLLQGIRKLKPLDVNLVKTVKDIRKIKNRGGIAVILGSQGAGFLGLDLTSLDFFYGLGMRIMQLTYQQRNQFGDGCGERTDAGLSDLGVQWVEKMNEVGMVISLSHVGCKTSLEVMEISDDPVIFDHSNCRNLCDHIRNLTDGQIQACADKKGVVGLTPLSMFVNGDKDPRELEVGDFIDHIDYVVSLVGIDHVGFGTDLSEGGFLTPAEILSRRRLYPGLFESSGLRKVEDEFLASGREKLYSYEVRGWIKSVSEIILLTEGLVDRGYSDQEIKKILGENFLRVFEKVWGS